MSKNRSNKIDISNLKVVNIEPTNKCNLKCTVCGDKKVRPVGFMNLEIYRRVLTQVDYFNPEVRLFNAGEPLLHPEISVLVNIAKLHVDKVLIHTNGTRLTSLLAHKLINSGLTHISFSIDGETKKEYEDIRKGARFEDVVFNIQNFLEFNNLGKNVHTTIQIIRHYNSPLELSKEFKEMFKLADKFYVRYPHNWDVDNSINGAAPGNYSGLCFFLVNYFTVLWDGKVSMCCADLNGEKIIGDIKEESLQTIWDRRLDHLDYCCKCERWTDEMKVMANDRD